MTPTKQTKVVSLGNLLDTPFPPRSYLLYPVLRNAESMMVWAAPGVGKTMWALSAALAMAGGGSFLGWEAERPFKVLYIDGEMPEQDLRDRLAMLIEAVPGIDREEARKNLKLMAKQAQEPGAYFPELSDEDNWPLLSNMLRERAYDIVILDNLSTLAFLDDENSSAAVNPVIKFLSEMKQSGIACIVIHHSNKNGKDYRGSSNLATTFEIIVGLTKVSDLLETTDGAAFKIEFQKKRNLTGALDLDNRIARLVHDDATGTTCWTIEASADETLKAICAVIQSGKVKMQKEIAEYLPEKYWPKESRPSEKWISNKVAEIRAKGMMTQDQIREAFDAAKDAEQGTLDHDEDF